MIDTRAVGQELQDLQHQIVGRIRKGQETVAGTIKTWAHAAQTASPLPKPQTLVAGVYDFAEQMIAAQRKLAGQVTHAAMPLARQGAALFGQSISQPAWSTARTSRKAASPKPAAETSRKAASPKPAAETSPAKSGAGTKAASGKPATTERANGTHAKDARSAKK